LTCSSISFESFPIWKANQLIRHLVYAGLIEVTKIAEGPALTLTASTWSASFAASCYQEQQDFSDRFPLYLWPYHFRQRKLLSPQIPSVSLSVQQKTAFRLEVERSFVHHTGSAVEQAYLY
jgi:hypothetical protein